MFCQGMVGGSVAYWSVCWSRDQAVWVLALAGVWQDNMLSQWLSPPKCINGSGKLLGQPDKMLRSNLWWTNIPSRGVWLAKCCKIQQLGPSYSTTYIYVQQHIFIFNILYLYSTIRIFFQLQPKLFSFNKTICSTSTKNNFIQQKYLFNFNRK